MGKKESTKPNIKYIHGDQTLLNDVRGMWEALNRYHCDRSEHFKQHYRTMTFEKRKAALLKKAEGGEMCVDIAVDEVTEKGVGYIVSTVDPDRVGEIQSVYIEAAYRRMGVGGALMRNALNWMDQKGVTEKLVEVSYGNEAAWGFYGRFGFIPRLTLLKQVKK
jgi:ribosomal protein S18 acetylase RimI-like enzyme